MRVELTLDIFFPEADLADARDGFPMLRSGFDLPFAPVEGLSIKLDPEDSKTSGTPSVRSNPDFPPLGILTFERVVYHLSEETFYVRCIERHKSREYARAAAADYMASFGFRNLLDD